MMDRESRQTVELEHPPQKNIDWGAITLFSLTVAAVVACTWIVWPFLPALTAAAVLAVVTRRPYRWLLRHVSNSSFAAAIALILVVLSVITPVLFMASAVGHHVLDTVRALQNGSPEHAFQQFLDAHPRIAGIFGDIADNIEPQQALEKGASAAAGKLGAFLGHSIGFLVQILVMLFVLFFLFRDADEALRLTRSLLPFELEETDYLLERARTAIEALVLGRFLVATIQGFIAGLTLMLLVVDGAVLFGAATMLFALVPAVGAYVVWLPLVVYLAAGHLWIRAIILLAVGSLVISTIDNILYPILVGSRLRLHTVPIFLSMLGGVWLLGVPGLVLGPIAFNVTASLLSIWRSRTRGEPLIIE